MSEDPNDPHGLIRDGIASEPKPERLKDREDWTVEEILEHARTGEKPVNPEYLKARRKALEDAGLEPDDSDEAAKAPVDMTAAEHLDRIQNERK